MPRYCKIKGNHDYYNVHDAGRDSFTARQLVDFIMENFHEDDIVVLTNDGGFTYGRINPDSFIM